MTQRFWLRLRALIRKEFRQLLRDKSNLAIGLVLPMVLILIFGYGMTMDVKNAPVTVVLEDSSQTARDAVAGLYGSPYIAATTVTNMSEAEQLMRARQVLAIVRLPSGFSHDLNMGQAKVQVILHGVDASSANLISGYISSSFALWAQKQATTTSGVGQVTIEQRMLFNAANSSTWYLIPGLIVLIMTIVGAFLTSLLVAREWERGTFEAMFVTPVQPIEMLIAKLVPNFVVGLVGLALCLLAAKLLFAVPMYGSLWIVLFGSVLYLLVALGLGLLISALTKSQFLASQVALIASFLPAMMLSGFVFDLRNAPSIVNVIGHIIPATYFVELLKTLYLAGNVWPMIVKDCAILAAYAAVLLTAALRVTRKRLD